MSRTAHSGVRPSRLGRKVVFSREPSPPPASEQAFGWLARQLDLTLRQAEVLHWIAEGKTNAEISIILGCSFHTVKNHLRVIFMRLRVTTRTGAAACAYRAHHAAAVGVRALPSTEKDPSPSA